MKKPLSCRLGRHNLFPIGYGTARCRRCRVVFSVQADGEIWPIDEAPAPFLKETQGA
jgi:hypothetical protein